MLLADDTWSDENTLVLILSDVEAGKSQYSQTIFNVLMFFFIISPVETVLITNISTLYKMEHLTSPDIILFQYLWQALDIVEGIKVVNSLVESVHPIRMSRESSEDRGSTAKNDECDEGVIIVDERKS